MVPLVFLVGLIFGVKRWPAVLAFVVTWPLFVLLFGDIPPDRIGAYWLIVLGNAAVGVAVHDVAAAFRRVMYSVLRTLLHRREVSNGV